MAIWKLIKDSNYEVSDEGQIRSPTKQVKSRYGYRIVKGRILKQTVASNGYYLVDLEKGVKSVHRLVAETFLNGDKTKTVNHKDGNKLNNNLSNLEYATSVEQKEHSLSMGLQGKKGKHTAIEMIDGDQVIRTFISMRQAAEFIEGCHQAISMCCNKKKKTYKGYMWNSK